MTKMADRKLSKTLMNLKFMQRSRVSELSDTTLAHAPVDDRWVANRGTDKFVTCSPHVVHFVMIDLPTRPSTSTAKRPSFIHISPPQGEKRSANSGRSIIRAL